MDQDYLRDIARQASNTAVEYQLWAHMGRLKGLDRSTETQEPYTNDDAIEIASKPLDKQVSKFCLLQQSQCTPKSGSIRQWSSLENQ